MLSKELGRGVGVFSSRNQQVALGHYIKATSGRLVLGPFRILFLCVEGRHFSCEIFGQLMERKKIAEATLKRIEPGSKPLGTRLLRLSTLPSAAKYESRLPYTIGSDPRRQRFVRWSGGSDSGSMGYVG